MWGQVGNHYIENTNINNNKQLIQLKFKARKKKWETLKLELKNLDQPLQMMSL